MEKENEKLNENNEIVNDLYTEVAEDYNKLIKEKRVMEKTNKQLAADVKQLKDDLSSVDQQLIDKASVIESLQEKNNELMTKIDSNITTAEKRTCEICCEEFGDNRKAMCFFPCGHARICQECLRKMRKEDRKKKQRTECPYDRREIKEAIPLFT